MTGQVEAVARAIVLLALPLFPLGPFNQVQPMGAEPAKASVQGVSDVAAANSAGPCDAELIVRKQNQVTIDGTQDPQGDYSSDIDCPSGVTIGTNVSGNFRVNAVQSPAKLQFYVIIADGTANAADSIILYLDVNHDHMNTSTDPDRAVVIQRDMSPSSTCDTCVHLTKVDLTNGTVLTGWKIVGKVGSGGEWSVEGELLMSDLGLNDLPDIMGIYLRVVDTPNIGLVKRGGYPSTCPTLSCPMAGWAHLKTRNPIDYMIVLDRSGSMLNQGKWDAAKQAANLFANTMAILTDHEFADRLGLVVFNWPCGGSVDQTTTVSPGLAPVPSFPAGNWLGTITDPLPDFCTPIGRGLNEAFSASNLDANTDMDDRERGVLLLSDGLHNRPVQDVPLQPQHISYHPCSASTSWIACTTSNVSVNTVGLGHDEGVDTDLLQKIAKGYNGGSYSLSTNLGLLAYDFLQNLETLYGINVVYNAQTDPPFATTGGDFRLIAIAFWNPPDPPEPIKVQDGTAPPPNCTTEATDAVSGFAICVISPSPQGTAWQIVAASGGFNQTPAGRFALLDLRVRATFAAAPVDPATGDAFIVTTSLHDRGRPVLHSAAHPVHVTVKVETPDQAVGTFVVTHQPGTCEKVVPSLPPLAGRPDSSAGAFGAHAIVGTGDPDPPLYAAVGSLLSDCQLAGLGRSAGGGLELRDNGSQGDQVADDGVYSLRLPAATVAGTYVFTFYVDGTTRDGERFTRTWRLARYVHAGATLEASDFGSRVVQQTGNLIVRQYYLLPRDIYGYVGPGRADRVRFLLERGPGVFVSPVIDYGNGYYARNLRYDRSLGTPVVVPEVNGSRLVPGARSLALSLHAGLSLPHGSLHGSHDDGFGVTVDIARRLTPTWTVAGLFGFHRFGEKGSSAHLDIYHVSGSLEGGITRGAVRFFAEAGGGVYILSPGPTKPGAHAGAGVEWSLTPSLSLGLSYRAHNVFTSGSNTTFSAVQVGGRLRP